MKKVATICVGMLLLAGAAFTQTWEFDSIFFDMQLPHSDSYGIHGVAVAPDGNIWIALHGGTELMDPTDFFVTPGGDTNYYRPLFILDPNTGEHVSFSPLRVIEFADGTLDTLHTGSPINGSGKGISVDNDGNILYSSWTTVYRINYQTGMGMNRYTPDDMSSITEAVQDENGLIYFSYVLGAARPIIILDNDFNLVGNAADIEGHINRTIVCTPDGKDLYLGSTWNGFGIEHWHSDIPGVLQFTVVDTFGNWRVNADSTIMLWASCLDWGPEGNIWAGNLRPDWSGPKGGRWYVYDPATKQRVDSVGISMGDSSAGGVYSPRGADWSADGKTMYLADWDYNIVGKWTLEPIGVEPIAGDVPRRFDLHQNYPNPFNPTTMIPFDIDKQGLVELRVYDIMGREVATLVNEQRGPGRYEVPFDGSNLASGVYYYRLTLDHQLLSKQMMLIK